MATKTLRKRVRVLLSNQETVSVNLIGAKVPKTVTVTKEIVVGHVVNCICTVVGGPTGGRCDLSKTPADAPYLIEPYRWPTTLRNIVKELRKIYPKLRTC